VAGGLGAVEVRWLVRDDLLIDDTVSDTPDGRW
jgi:hypothetical protein